ncbi:serine/threonine-protein kinase STY17 isoform X1 [Balamuthia mandrillaris]
MISPFQFYSHEIPSDEIRLVRKIGEGSFGTVWKGTCFQKEVAIKIPHVQINCDATLSNLRSEIEIMSSMPHPNICLFMGACTLPGNVKIVTELMDGDLASLLESDEHLTLYERMKMAKDAALGMTWLHFSTPTIIHRDLKTANLLVLSFCFLAFSLSFTHYLFSISLFYLCFFCILSVQQISKVQNQYKVKLCDFGLAQIKPRHRMFLRDKTNAAKGTPLWMAPEVLQGKDFNEKSDVYSFGLVLWEILTREEPFSNHFDFDGFVRAVCIDHERPPLPPDCPALLGELMEACWHPDPLQRPNFQEISHQLDLIVIHAAIADEHGRRFWAKRFLRQEQVEGTLFFKALYSFLGLQMPLDVKPSGLLSKPLQTNQFGLEASGGEEQHSSNISTPSAREKERKEDTFTAQPQQQHHEEDEVIQLRCLKALLLTKDPKSGKKTVNIERFGKVLHWFGPLMPGSGSGATFLESVCEILSKEWFHGDIETAEAQRRLSGQAQGCYLVRFSNNPLTPGCYTISRVAADDHIVHMRVTHQPGVGFSVNGERCYASLDELIYALSGPLKLKSPCAGSQYSQLFGTSQMLAGYQTLAT